jgi:hypothetical protein
MVLVCFHVIILEYNVNLMKVAAGYFLYLNDMTLGKHKIDLKVIDLLKGNEGPSPKFDPPREGVFDINIQ